MPNQYTKVSDVISEVQSVFLNDPSGVTYTSAVILPHLKAAYSQFENALEENGISNKDTIAPVKTITAGDTQYLPLPSDFMWPLDCKERVAGSTDDFISMIQREFEPSVQARPALINWTFRLDGIYFTPSTMDREVLLYYRKLFPEINSVSDNVFSKDVMSYLSAKTAAYVHLFISQNTTLADTADKVATANLTNLINRYVKTKQAVYAVPRVGPRYGW